MLAELSTYFQVMFYICLLQSTYKYMKS